MKLHPVTWLMIAISAAEVIAALLIFFDGARSLSLDLMQTMTPDSSNWNALMLRSIPTFTYGIGWLGTAAMVEFLFRIWRELVALRQRSSSPQELTGA
jgi:hypothetical protein